MKLVKYIPIFLVFVSSQITAQSFELEIIRDEMAGSNGVIYEDFNDDGIREYVVSRFSQDVITLIYDDGTGIMQEKDIISIDQPGEIEMGDFNQDGRMDIALTSPSSSGIRILRNNGDLEFSVQTLNTFDFKEGGDVVAADFDNDGDLDLAVTSYKNNQLALFEMTSPDFFSFDVTTIDDDVFNTREVNVADFNNDGLMDIVLSVRFGGEANVYINNGSLNFTKISMTSEEAVGNAVADFNNDGFMDFVVTSFVNDDLILFLNSGNNSFNEILIDGSAKNANSVECFDINLDGNSDIVVGSDQGLYIFILEDVENFQFSREDIPFDGWIGPFDIVDVDEDGDLDIVATSTALPGVVHYNNLAILSSTNELSGISISVYPNPVSQYLNIEISEEINYQTKLHDLNGRLIFDKANAQTIDVTAIPKGMYILEIRDLTSLQRTYNHIVIEK